MRLTRVVVLVVVVGLLVAGGLVDRKDTPAPSTAVATRQLDSLMPTAAGASALTSAWYCPGATASPGGVADGTITVANPTDDSLSATLTLVPSEGDPVAVPFAVEPFSRSVIHQADFVQAPYVAALVDFNGGGGAVEQQVAGPNGSSVSPCASASSDRWYFATGGTDRDQSLLLALFNPFPGDAIVDLAFSTDQGPSAPPDFQGLVVPARGLKVIDVGEHVRRRVAVATTVVARSGRVVASQLQVTAGAAPSLTSTLGAPSVGSLWVFPDGLTADGISERYHVYNPGTRDAAVTVDLVLDQGEAEPFDLTVPAGGTVTVVANDEARIPKDVAHAAVVRSVNGEGVVAQRAVVAQAPAPRVGSSSMLGARRAATRWVLATGSATATSDEWVVVYNDGDQPATVSMEALAAGQLLDVEGVQDINVPAGRRVAVRLGDHIAREDLPLLVTASRPVYVERDVYAVGGHGVHLMIGIPAA